MDDKVGSIWQQDTACVVAYLNLRLSIRGDRATGANGGSKRFLHGSRFG